MKVARIIANLPIARPVQLITHREPLFPSNSDRAARAAPAQRQGWPTLAVVVNWLLEKDPRVRFRATARRIPYDLRLGSVMTREPVVHNNVMRPRGSGSASRGIKNCIL